VAARKKKQVHEEHENHERWLVSWADFMTLLFATFTALYAVSTVDVKKAQQAEQSIRLAMNLTGKGTTKMHLFAEPPKAAAGAIPQMDGSTMSLNEEQLVEALRRKLEARVRPFVMPRANKGPEMVTVTVEGHRVTVRMAASEFFDPGQSALRPQVLPVVDAIAAELVQLGRPLAIEGHTDDSPIRGGRFRDNWELSASRAATVVAYLEAAHRVKPQLLSATGRADSRPLASGTDDVARETNRRVEIVVELDVKEPPRARASRGTDDVAR
jgi:chemotaxis protein MotB